MNGWVEQIERYAAVERVRRQPRGVASYVKTLRRLARYGAGRSLDADLVADYLASRTTVTTTTRATEWTVIASFDRYLRKRRLIPTSLMELCERPRGRRRLALSAPIATVIRLAAWINQAESDADDDRAPRTRRLCGLCLYAGVRISEAVAMNWEDIDEIGRELVVRCGKGGHGRRIPVAPPLERLFAAVPRDERHGPVVTNLNGRAVTIGGAGHIFDRYLPRVVGVKLSPHMLRRAFATRLDERGHSLRVIQDLLGHSSLATTERYLGVDRARKRAAMDDLDGPWYDQNAED